MQFSTERLAAALSRYGIGVHPGEWRVPPIETYPRVIAFAQTIGGKLVLYALFAALMKPLSDKLWFWMTTASVVVALAGRHRHLAAVLCTGVLLALAPNWFQYTAVYAASRQEALIDTLHLGYVRAATLAACVPLAVATVTSPPIR